MFPIKHPTSLQIACVSLALLLLAGCSKSPEQLIGSAKAYIDKSDYKAASIELRSALQAQPDSAEARYLLGRALTQTGDLVGAEKELRKAMELGYRAEPLLPQLARVMLDLGQTQKVIGEFGDKQLSDPHAYADLLTCVGDAHLATNQPAQAQAAYAKALAAQPDHAQAKLGQAKLALLGRDLNRAGQIADSVAAAAPGEAEAWKLKAQIALAARDGKEAVANYRKALEVKPGSLDTRLALGMLLLQQGDEKGALAEAQTMAKQANGDPRTRILQSQLALEQRNYPEARDLALSLLRENPEHNLSRRTAGISYFYLRRDAEAQEHLRKSLEANRGDLLARRLLITSYLRSGDVPRAKRSLKEGLEIAPKDTGFLVLAGEVAIAERDLDGAIGEYQAALASGGLTQEVPFKARLGQLQLAAGKTSEGLQLLEAASAANNEQYQSDLLLALYYLGQGKPAEAMSWIEKIDKKQPQDPIGPTLRGAAQLQSKNDAAARSSFESALQRDIGFAPALVALARLDLRDGRVAEAEAHFSKALDKQPGNEAVTLAYVEFLQAQKAPVAKRKAVLSRLVQAQPAAARGRVALIAALIESGEARDAATTAQEGLASDPENPALLRAGAAALLAAGNTDQAVTMLLKLTNVQPQSPVPQTLLADAYLRAGDHRRALEALQRALKIRPDYLPAQVTAARLHVKMGDAASAIAIAREIQRARPKAPGGYILEEEILRNDKRFAEADRALKHGLERVASPILAAQRHRLMLTQGDAQRAKEFANGWIAANPRDTAFRLYLAAQAMDTKDYPAAAAHYRAVLALSPDNVAALNNLAWVGGQLNDPNALGYAERAHSLAPRSVAVLDTLGWLHIRRGNSSKGIELLREALRLAPDADGVRINLAKALLQAGDKQAARQELEVVVKREGNAGEAKAEAQALVNSL